MIKRLRRNIILVNMLMVGTVILAIFTVVCLNSYRTSCDNLLRSMTDTIRRSNRFEENKEKRENVLDNNREKKFDAPMQLSDYVIVRLDSDGNITEKTENNLTIEDDSLKEYVSAALSDGGKEGQLTDFGLMYVRDDFQAENKLIFAETASIYTALRNTVLICLLLFFGSMIIILLISLWLSGFSVKPVKKAWQQQKQFVADASHELKTPLTVILANNSIMMSHKNNRVSDEEQWLESTQEEAQHMKQLIDQMLFLAKSDAGNSNIEFSEVELSEIIEGTALNFEPVAFERGVMIETMLDEDVRLNGNSMQLKQLAHILIDNAVKYSADNSTVTITLRKNSDSAVLAVNNRGNVIAKSDLEHIFDRFYRAEKSRTTKGYGLGLSIAQNIVQSMNGKLTAESNEENGTTFTAQFKSISKK